MRAGAGGVDAEDWTAQVLAMTCGWALKRNWKLEAVDRREGREGGLRHATVKINGPRAFGLLRSLHGAHRVAHHSRFGGQGKRQTSFCAVEVLPVTPVRRGGVRDSDVEITTFAGSSKGGQHANRSSTNVRARHRPTGITATATGRSQAQNRQAATAVLLARVIEHERRTVEPAADQVAAGFGDRARSYVFTPYRLVRDERTATKTTRLHDVMGGDLDELALEHLLWQTRLHRAAADRQNETS